MFLASTVFCYWLTLCVYVRSECVCDNGFELKIEHYECTMIEYNDTGCENLEYCMCLNCDCG